MESNCQFFLTRTILKKWIAREKKHIYALQFTINGEHSYKLPTISVRQKQTFPLSCCQMNVVILKMMSNKFGGTLNVSSKHFIIFSLCVCCCSADVVVATVNGRTAQINACYFPQVHTLQQVAFKNVAPFILLSVCVFFFLLAWPVPFSLKCFWYRSSRIFQFNTDCNKIRLKTECLVLIHVERTTRLWCLVSLDIFLVFFLRVSQETNSHKYTIEVYSMGRFSYIKIMHHFEVN